MRYYKYLYLAEGLEKKAKKIMQRLDAKKLQLNVYLIVLPKNEKNNLEILQSAQLLQPDYPNQDFLVVGITKNYEDALEIVEKIVQEVYDVTKGADIRSYILEKEREE